MTHLFIRLTIFFLIAAIVMPVSAPAAQDSTSDQNVRISPTPTQFVTLTFETPQRVTGETFRPGYPGEVEVPMRRKAATTFHHAGSELHDFIPTAVFTPPTIFHELSFPLLPRSKTDGYLPPRQFHEQSYPPPPRSSKLCLPLPLFRGQRNPKPNERRNCHPDFLPDNRIGNPDCFPDHDCRSWYDDNTWTTTVPVVTVTVQVPSDQVHYPEDYLAPESTTTRPVIRTRITHPVIRTRTIHEDPSP